MDKKFIAIIVAMVSILTLFSVIAIGIITGAATTASACPVPNADLSQGTYNAWGSSSVHPPIGWQSEYPKYVDFMSMLVKCGQLTEAQKRSECGRLGITDADCGIKAPCKDECNVGTKQECSADKTGFKRCIRDSRDANSCFKWGPIHPCPSGRTCENGLCKSTSVPTVPPTKPIALLTKCNDTDGGIKYEVQGTTTGLKYNDASQTHSLTDRCIDNIMLMEYYCGGAGRNFVIEQSYKCSASRKVCSNGICK